MWPYTCLFNDGHGICEATGTKCIDSPDCIEKALPGTDAVITRGEVEESFEQMRAADRILNIYKK